MRNPSPKTWKSSALIMTAAATLLAFATPVAIPPDEIHSRTTPYSLTSDVILRAETRLVEVPVVVRDGRRSAVQGLRKGDFQLFDDGKKQEVTSFSIRTQRPNGRSGSQVPGSQASGNESPAGGTRFIALCFDDLHMFAGRLQAVKTAAEEYVKTNLAHGDQVAVIPTSRSQKSAFISDVPEIIAQIEQINSAPLRALPDIERCPTISPYEAYQLTENMDPGNQLLDAKVAECSACYKYTRCPESEIQGRAHAIWTKARTYATDTIGVIDGLVDGMANLSGQRVILLTSAGFLTGTQEAAVDKLMNKARRAQVVINSLNSEGLTGDDVMRSGAAQLASGTGGEYYRGNDASAGFRELGQAPEAIYMLGFTPSAPADGRFHKLKVQVSTSGRYDVQSRLGYVSAQEPASTADSPAAKLRDEMKSSETLNGFPISFQWQQWPARLPSRWC